MLGLVAPPPPLFLSVFISGLLHHGVFFLKQERKTRRLLWSLVVALVPWMLPPHSFTCWWHPVTIIVSQWPDLIAASKENKLLGPLVFGGPLGRGCGKVCEIVAACLLWNVLHRDESLPLTWGPMPSASTWALVTVLSVVVNITLSLWSRYIQSRGRHEGVHSMVESSLGRKLTIREHVQMGGLAIINSICEEVCSRGFWYHEYQQRGKLSRSHANLAQAACFGVWHYYGIPSGWTGVGLTFVYGFIMGLLYEYDGPGLLLPVVAHAVADYYIFATIARQQHQGSSQGRHKQS